MSVIHTKYVIIDIIEMHKAEIAAMGMTLMQRPELDMYMIRAVLKSYLEQTNKGRGLLKKLGHGDKMPELESKYLNYTEAFTASLPCTHKTLNDNKYHVGGEIMIAYYPTSVYGEFHMADGDKK